MQMQKPPIYLDYAATTPVDPRVAERMCQCLTMDGSFANPASSSHAPGRTAKGVVEIARREVAALVNCDPREIVWTSGATESDNLAIKGVAHFYRDKGRHIVTCRTEHKAVLDTCEQLEREGFEVTYLMPDCDGIVSPGQLEDALRDDTILVSIMHVNNEIGVIQDIDALGRICRERGTLFHVDAAQSAGKIAIDLAKLPVDLMSFSAHKIYGPKGIGALYVRREPRTMLEPLIHGGGHEGGMRAGTLATHQICGMGAAFRIAGDELQKDQPAHHRAQESPLGGCSGARRRQAERAPGALYSRHPERQLRRGGGREPALCFAQAGRFQRIRLHLGHPRTVLRSAGARLLDQLAQSSIRFSIGRFTNEADIDFAISEVQAQVARLRSLAPASAAGLKAVSGE